MRGTEVSREIRLWITTIIFPLSLATGLALKNPEVQRKLNEMKEKREERKRNR